MDSTSSARASRRTALVRRSLLATVLLACARERASDAELAADTSLVAAITATTRLDSAASPDSAPAIADPARAIAAADSASLDSLTSRLLPFDTPAARRKAEGSECIVYSRWVVVAREIPGDVGSDVFVRPAAAVSADAATLDAGCAADSLPGDLVVRNEWAEYFMGMHGDWLLLDSGTGPLRGLVVWDVASRRKLAAMGGVDFLGFRDSTTLVLWVAGEDTVARAMCPEIPEGLGAGADTLFAMELPGERRSALGHWRCAARQ